MNPEELRSLILGGEIATPFEILTRGGRTYRIDDHRNIFVTPAYPDTLVIAVPRQGIALVGLGAIDAVHAEHEAVAEARK